MTNTGRGFGECFKIPVRSKVDLQSRFALLLVISTYCNNGHDLKATSTKKNTLDFVERMQSNIL